MDGILYLMYFCVLSYPSPPSSPTMTLGIPVPSDIIHPVLDILDIKAVEAINSKLLQWMFGMLSPLPIKVYEDYNYLYCCYFSYFSFVRMEKMTLCVCLCGWPVNSPPLWSKRTFIHFVRFCGDGKSFTVPPRAVPAHSLVQTKPPHAAAVALAAEPVFLPTHSHALTPRCSWAQARLLLNGEKRELSCRNRVITVHGVTFSN